MRHEGEQPFCILVLPVKFSKYFFVLCSHRCICKSIRVLELTYPIIDGIVYKQSQSLSVAKLS